MGIKRVAKVAETANTVTIGEAFEEFIADKRSHGIVEKTLKNYRQSYNYFLHDELDDEEDYDISEVFKAHVQQWVDMMLRNQQKRISTVNHYLRDIRTFLYWCMDSERGYIDPPYKLDLVKGQETLPKLTPEDEVDKLLQKPTNISNWTEWRNWAVANWIVGTGTRASTVINIKVGDIDFNDNTIALRHTKDKKLHVISLADSLMKVLKTYIKACLKEHDSDEDWLFPNTEYHQLTYDALAHSFRTYCQKYRGVNTTSLHSLRHYFATFCIKNGMPHSKLQKQLGHSTFHMTQRYVHLADEDVREDFEKYNPLDNRKKKR